MPIITLTTDFGTSSPYVAAMKAVILGAAPDVTLVDVSHDVAPFDMAQGAFVLWLGTRHFQAGVVHMGVVDPGVGTERRPIAFALNGSFYVGPDNGLFDTVIRETDQAPTNIVQLHRPAGISATFEGRDVFAPTAAALALGRPLAEIGEPAEGPLVELPVHGPAVVWVDRFGNLITNLKPPLTALQVNGHDVRVLARTFGDMPADQPFVYVGSVGFIAVGVSKGRADVALGASAGTPLMVLS
jgi:S-adenosyl-L-methionine hydrolase (adenosine-forming)